MLFRIENVMSSTCVITRHIPAKTTFTSVV